MKDYNKTFWGISLILGLSICVFALLNLTVTFHVSGMSYTKGEYGAVLKNQSVRIKFNRPLANTQDFPGYVTLEPETPVRIFPVGNELVINFEENLLASQTYEIKLNSELQDIYGETLREDKTLKLETNPQNLFFVSEADSGQVVKSWEPNSEFEAEIYRTENEIIKFDVADGFLAVVEKQSKDVNFLKLVDLEHGSAEIITDTENEKVYSVQLFPQKGFLLMLKERIKYEQGYSLSDGGRWIYIYDLTSRRTSKLELASLATIPDIDEFELAQDGGALLVRDSSQARYYLVDINNTDNNVPLGRFVGTGGLNRNGEKVIFNEVDPLGNPPDPFITTVDYQGVKTLVSVENKYGIDPSFFHNSNRIAYSQNFKFIENTRGFFELVIVNGSEDGGSRPLKIRFVDHSLELPSISVDDRFLAAERYTLEAMQDILNTRVIGYQAKPAGADIVVYRLDETTEPIKVIPNAYNPIWR